MKKFLTVVVILLVICIITIFTVFKKDDTNENLVEVTLADATLTLWTYIS